jgi:hypothetical protein
MAVTASGRIWIPCQDRLTVDTFRIPIIRVAGCAFLNDADFFPFPWGHIVDIFMTVFTLNIIDKMGAGIMLCPLFLMTPVAGDRLRMNFAPLGFPMGFDIGDIPVATIA